ncbi:MAG: SMP-30/gluconolactonase/LRE family protein [Chloracidobacterium sp.]|nr:SMP-30/gluconolactonase/LRE family protein [Chloracidobacterium sp.]
MSRAGKILGVEPSFAIAGGEVAVACEGFRAEHGSGHKVFVGGAECKISGASSSRVLVRVPNDAGEGLSRIHFELNGQRSELFPITVGKLLTDGMHIVANPAVDPSDDALVLTRSGSRGQHLDATLFRLEPDGYLDEMPESILNPTGIAFDREGQLFVTNRAQGEVYVVGRDGSSSVFATGLGIATGIAFDADDVMHVGDRMGTIWRVYDVGEAEAIATLDASVAAYHLAFGPDGRLYVTAPGLASRDAVWAVDRRGEVSEFFRGFGRPQGLAFDKLGNLYVAACYQGRHGIARITPDGKGCEQFVAGDNVVGLCFTRQGDMIVATSDSVYSLRCGIEGTLL